jgi:hypothetical protein
VTQVVEGLPSKLSALSSNSSMAKKKVILYAVLHPSMTLKMGQQRAAVVL